MMKLKKYIYGVALGALALTVASCYNADKDFPDYEGGTKAYFAYQNPIRTLTTTHWTMRTSAVSGPPWVVPTVDATPW